MFIKILKSALPGPHALRDLQDQPGLFTQTLVALEGVANHYSGDLLTLDLPLQQCDMQCASIALKIAKHIAQPEENATRCWADMTFSYCLIFKVALQKARLYT